MNPFTQTWSLGVEEQFYFLFPLLAWFSGFARKDKFGVRNLFLLVGFLATISCLAFIGFYSTNPAATYFLMPTRFWEMATGSLLFLGIHKHVAIEKFRKCFSDFSSIINNLSDVFTNFSRCNIYYCSCYSYLNSYYMLERKNDNIKFST